MPPTCSFFAEVKTSFQKENGGVVFPVVLSPAVCPSSLEAVVKEQKTWLESLLHRHGAILLRGLGSSATASHFNDVVEALGYEELPYVGGAAPRTKVVGRVYTANECPPHRKIHFHHEMAYIPEHPGKLFFFCEEAAASGGETSIVLSHVVYETLKEKHPEFVEKLEKVGLIYTRIMGEEDDPSSEIGRGWKSMFSTTDKTLAQQRSNYDIKYDEIRQRKIWFNAVAVAYTAVGDDLNDPKKTVSFGDKNLLPENIIHDCLRMMEEESVAIRWQKGDLLIVDNFAVLHAREPFTPPRRILAALCK